MRYLNTMCAKLIGIVLMLAPGVCVAEGWHYDDRFLSPLAKVDSLNFRYVESPDWSQYGGSDTDRHARLFALYERALREKGITLIEDPVADYRIPLLFVVNAVHHWPNEPFMTFSPAVEVIGLVSFNGTRMPGTVWSDRKSGYCAFPPQPECPLDSTLSSLASDLAKDFGIARARKKAER